MVKGAQSRQIGPLLILQALSYPEIIFAESDGRCWQHEQKWESSNLKALPHCLQCCVLHVERNIVACDIVERNATCRVLQSCHKLNRFNNDFFVAKTFYMLLQCGHTGNFVERFLRVARTVDCVAFYKIESNMLTVWTCFWEACRLAGYNTSQPQDARCCCRWLGTATVRRTWKRGDADCGGRK